MYYLCYMDSNTNRMGHLFTVCFYLMGHVLFALTHCNSSDFHLNGDYLLGGLFDIHTSSSASHDRPEAIDCSSQAFSLSGYRRFQLMRFSVEEINNSTKLLPNVSLGFKIFDHCSVANNFPDVLNLISTDGLIQPWSKAHQHVSAASKVVAVVGPFSSTDTLTVAPLFMMDLIPLVSYGAASSEFSEKAKYWSFLRTVHSNKDTVRVIVSILEYFQWHWVAFLGSDDAYGNDGQELFIKMIKDTHICMAYTSKLKPSFNYSVTFQQIEAHRITTIVVFAPKRTAVYLIESAILMGVTNKVWIAGETWSLNEKLPKRKDIQKIGTVLGVSQPVLTISGFSDYLLTSHSKIQCGDAGGGQLCDQVCNCSSLSAQDIISMDPSYSFSVYSAVYAIAHALHNVLQCDKDTCHRNNAVNPQKVLAELTKSNFSLLNETIRFDEHGDPMFGSFFIVFWNQSGDIEEVGFYKFLSSIHFFIDDSRIRWHGNGMVPTSRCSLECPVGFAKKQDGIYKCCFTCEECPKGTYINITDDPYTCVACKETEWSTAASTSCTQRQSADPATQRAQPKQQVWRPGNQGSPAPRSQTGQRREPQSPAHRANRKSRQQAADRHARQRTGHERSSGRPDPKPARENPPHGQKDGTPRPTKPRDSPQPDGKTAPAPPAPGPPRPHPHPQGARRSPHQATPPEPATTGPPSAGPRGPPIPTAGTPTMEMEQPATDLSKPPPERGEKKKKCKKKQNKKKNSHQAVKVECILILLKQLCFRRIWLIKAKLQIRISWLSDCSNSNHKLSNEEGLIHFNIYCSLFARK
ncbi:taste receptor type 1 member 1-like isoform X2 [Nerophis ophidion]|uniref:taste receptor type 1 member 1-like isoform X2 n=1 Tax=Nerophis ophidion TaxID=159077 RepID=UPI002ADFAF19|nr:taste receptor type 1 member 1-like isoform X2 [Nerophis ophidion]